MNELLTKNFLRKEFMCHGIDCCGHSAPIDIILVEKLQILRRLLGPLIVTSGFRCIIYNNIIGGKEDSEHTKGRAADIEIPKNINEETMFQAVKSLNIFGGIGRYDTFIHLDVGKKRDWDERTRSS